MSILSGLGHVIKTGFEMTETGQRLKESRQKDEEHDQKFADLMMGRGARYVEGNTVRRDLTLPDGRVVEGGLLDKAGSDGRRIVKHKTADGKTISFELGTPDEQIKAHAVQAQRGFEAGAPMRQQQQAEKVTGLEQDAAATSRGKFGEETKQREQIGMPLPTDIADDLGMDPNRKFLPSEVDNVISSAGAYQNYRSQAEARKQKPTDPIKTTHMSEDAQGNQVQVITRESGAVEEKPLAAKGKGVKADGGGLTPYQQYQMNRQGKADQEKQKQRSSLAQVVIDNPAMWDQLGANEKANIAPELAQSGFVGFGKPMTEGAVKQMTQTRTAIDSLKDLRQTLKENEDNMGPLTGLLAKVPGTKAQQVQAKINLVKQRVGKALEGGVLRKEDEQKYKEILATITDVPETAIVKLDQVTAELEREVANFTEQQRRGGRRMDTGQPTARPAQGGAAAPAGNEPTAVNPKTGDRVVLRGGQWVPLR